MATTERVRRPLPAGFGILVEVGLFMVGMVALVVGATTANGPLILLAVIVIIVAAIGLNGFFIVQPNHAAALVLFGNYARTVRDSGFHWANPFYSRRKISASHSKSR